MPKDRPTSDRYREVMTGEREPVGEEKGWTNLKEGQTEHNFRVMNPEKRREICRKGAAAVHKLHGEKKTAKEALERVLTLKVTDEIIAGADLPDELAERLKRDNPDCTLYDLIQIVAAGRAVGGNIKAAEYIRDTYGDKPTERVDVDVSAQVITDSDRALLEAINARLEDTGAHIEVVKDIGSNADGGA